MLIDTNILIRYLLQDHPELSKRATDIIINHQVVCLDAVVYEVIHVLKSVYSIDRMQIAELLIDLFSNNILHSDNKAITLKALVTFKETSMDFIDCLLIAHQMIHGARIQSFDKKLNNYIKRMVLS